MPFFTTEDTGTDNATGDSLPVSQHDATFEQTFLPSARGDQRIRYQNDINNYVGELQAAQAAHQADVMAHDVKGAQVLHTQALMEAQKQQHDFEMQMQPYREQLLQAQIASQQAQAKQQIQKEIQAHSTAADAVNAHTELDRQLYDTSIPPDVRKAQFQALPEAFPNAMRDPSFKERYNQILQENKAREAATAREPDTEGLFNSPQEVFDKYPGSTVAQSQTRKGKYYATNIPDPNRPQHHAEAAEALKGRAFDAELKAYGVTRNDLVNSDWKSDVHPDEAGNKIPVRYLEKQSGTITLPTDVFNSLKGRLKQISSPAAAPTITTPGGTSVTLPAQTQSAPVIPADHAAFLRAHPEKAASFDQTYGAGTSAKILGQ